MRVDIHAPWSVNDYLNEIILKKITNLSKYFGRINAADIFLKKAESTAEVEIRVQIPGTMLFAKSKADNFEKGVAEATEKIRKQLVKKSGILNAKRN